MKPKISVMINGQVKEYDVILTFKNDINNKDYVVYTDNEYDNSDKLRIFAVVYNPLTNEFVSNVETQEEWSEIYKILDTVLIS